MKDILASVSASTARSCSLSRYKGALVTISILPFGSYNSPSLQREQASVENRRVSLEVTFKRCSLRTLLDMTILGSFDADELLWTGRMTNGQEELGGVFAGMS
jgi:hypothetical protein